MSIVWQPKDRACLSRSGFRSETITAAAPSKWQAAAQAKPTGPAPATNTFVPGPTPAETAPWYPVGKISDRQVRSLILAIAWALSGNFKRLKSAYGTIAYSA